MVQYPRPYGFTRLYASRSEDLHNNFSNSDLFQSSIHLNSPGSIHPMLPLTAQQTSQSHSHFVSPGTQLLLSEPIRNDSIAASGLEHATL